MGRIKFIRYPGGKQRLLNHLLLYLPTAVEIQGRYIEPFVGGGSVFFSINPKNAILSDINKELIDLFRGIRYAPKKIWELYSNFPSTKVGYYKIRDDFNYIDLISRAARTLFLNRTCFKGMWRHNSQGKFNIGYGGQDRRWVICEEDIKEVSNRLKGVKLLYSDFQEIIDNSKKGDFIFLDPPYKPNEIECLNEHYSYGCFTFEDHIRLSISLQKASDRGVKWALTTSSHQKIIDLFDLNNVVNFPVGTGPKPGILTINSGEVLILNYKEKEIEN